MKNEVGFKILRGTGFQITFDNKVTVSIQFGHENYCDCNLNTKFSSKLSKKYEYFHSAQNAEVAVMGPAGSHEYWLTKEMYFEVFGKEIFDDVIGYIDPEKIPSIINWAKNWKSKKTKIINAILDKN